MLPKDLFRRFASDERGNIAIVFALATVPMVALVGAAVDYSRASSAKSYLSGVADAAVLEAVSNSALVSMTKLPDYGKASTEELFRSKARSVPGLTIDYVNATVQQSSASRSVTLAYSATMQNYFAQFLNKASTALGGRAESSVQMPVYMDFYLLLDNSPSMGLAATPADIKVMEDNTRTNPGGACAFACHDASQPNADYYTLAKKLNVTMRMDVVRQATKALIDTAARTQAVTGQFGIGIYAFNSTVQQVLARTNLEGPNLQAAQAAADKLDIVTVPYHGYNMDRFTNLDGLAPYIGYFPSGGTGTSSASPKTVLFLVSDGLADEPTPGNPNGRTIKPIPTTLCDQIKSRNVQIAALYTTYYAMNRPNDSWYMTNVAPSLPLLGSAMQRCASPGLYFEVSPSQGISDAMQALFQKAVGQARLTR